MKLGGRRDCTVPQRRGTEIDPKRDRVTADARKQFPIEGTAGYAIRVEPMRQHLVSEVRPAILELMGAVIFLLLITAVTVVRLSGLFVLACLYVVAPACLVTWISPDFKGIARWWFASFVTYSLWGIAYALVLKVDVVLLESVDGRPHLEQVKPALEAKKPVFIDKPVAGSLADAIQIF